MEKTFDPTHVENIEPGDPQFWMPGSPERQFDCGPEGTNHAQAHIGGYDTTVLVAPPGEDYPLGKS